MPDDSQGMDSTRKGGAVPARPESRYSLTRVIREWLAARKRRKAAAIVRAEEQRRLALMQMKARRKAAHREYKYLDGELRQATTRSLAAFVGRV
jgi:hypothetical protein